MIDDEHRGYIIELIGAKLLSVDHSVQIIGMSATISVLMMILLLSTLPTNGFLEHISYGAMA